MVTSRSDDARGGETARAGEAHLAGDGGTPDGDPPDVRIPDSASGEEAAAIAAAIEGYLAGQRAAAAAEDASEEGTQPWNGRRWTFAGRLGNLTGRAARVPDGAPRDGWSAIGRADRF